MQIDKYIRILRNQNKGKSFTFFAERCETSEENPYRIKIAEKTSFSDVEVLILAGGHGADGYMRDYNALLKRVDEFIKQQAELSEEDVKVGIAVCDFGKYHYADIARETAFLSASEQKYIDKIKASMSQEEINETFNPAYIQDIFNAKILPRISQNKGRERLNINNALQNIRKLNIVAHCHGGYVAMHLEKLMNNKMQELGYSSEEQQKIKSQLLVLAYNPDCPKGLSKLHFITIESAKDRHNKYYNYLKEWLLMKPRDFGVCYMTKKWGRTLMCTQVDKSGIEGNPPPKYVRIDVNEWFKHRDDKPKVFTLGEHDFLGFKPAVNMSKGALWLQRMAGNILINSIKNSLQQKGDSFIPIPNIQNLVSQNMKDKLYFAKTALIGFKLEQQLFMSDKNKIDAYASSRRSMPTITLD